MPRKARNTGRKLAAAEAKAARAVAPRRKKPARLVEAIGQLGDQPELRTVSGIVIAAGILSANRRLVRAGVRMLLAHEIATLAKDVIKERIDRTRPHSAKSHSERAVKQGRHTAKTKIRRTAFFFRPSRFALATKTGFIISATTGITCSFSTTR